MNLFQTISVTYYALHNGEPIREKLRVSLGRKLAPQTSRRLAQNDTALVADDLSAVGHRRYSVVRLMVAFTITFHGKLHELAMVRWFEKVLNGRNTRSVCRYLMPWIKENDNNEAGMLTLKEKPGNGSVIDINTIERGCHLIPIWSERPSSACVLPNGKRWLLNKHIDRWSFWELY